MDADVGVQPSSADAEEASNDDDVTAKTENGNETESTEEQLKKKPKKEKVGFRDRKVCTYSVSWIFFYFHLICTN